MTTENYVKICPQCGNTDIMIPPAGQDIEMSVQDYCKVCKAKGIFPEVKVSKVAEFQKAISHKKKSLK